MGKAGIDGMSTLSSDRKKKRYRSKKGEAPSVKDVQVTKLTKQQKRDLKRKNHSVTQLKRVINVESVYKRPVERPQPYGLPCEVKNRFLTPSDNCYNDVISTCYDSFKLQSPATFDKNFHVRFKTALEGLETDDIYQFDFIQPAGLGTDIAKTFVTRCLIGVPGTTYKYLGLRMFSIPWTMGEVGASKHSIEIGRLNLILIQRSKMLLNELHRPYVGSCEFNLTLINRYISSSSSILNFCSSNLI